MSRARSVVQMLLAVLGWLTFGAAWLYVFSAHALDSRWWIYAAAILSTAALVLLVTLLWVRYNIGIYRHKGRRVQVPRAIYDFTRDAQGTRVSADFAALRMARYVEISLDTMPDGTTRKRDVSGSTERTEEEAAACTM